MKGLQESFDRFATLIYANSLLGALILLAVSFLIDLVLSLIFRRAVRLMIARDKDRRLDRLGATFPSKFAQVFL